MNPYIICNPYRFTTGAPTPNSKPHGLVWSQFGDLQGPILEHAAIKHDFRNLIWCRNPLAEQLRSELRDEHENLWCDQTLTFQRKRKGIQDPRGELAVTITRSLAKDSFLERELTKEELTFCETQLKYSKTWSDVEKIILSVDHRQHLVMYDVNFVIRNKDKTISTLENQDNEVPGWVKWSKVREAQARPILEKEFFLTRSTPEEDVQKDNVNYDKSDFIYYAI
jgi:hypothetical protein